MPSSARQLAFNIIKAVSQGAYADVALQRTLSPKDNLLDRKLATELAYGTVRRQRTLDALIDQLATKKAEDQPPDLRLILQLGLYQLRYLDHIPNPAAIHATVELAKQQKLGGLSKVVNGILRRYLRESEQGDPLTLPKNEIARMGLQHSYPNWIIQAWVEQIGSEATDQLCQWLSHSPSIDLRINPRKTSRAEVQAKLAAAQIQSFPLETIPQALRLEGSLGRLPDIPGFEAGWWMVQEAGAQLVSHLLDPQPGWTVLDLCAAPGGKTLHLAELMNGQGVIWACDPTLSRLRRIQQNLKRLAVDMVQVWHGDGRQLPDSMPSFDAALVDAPCSGLGTLHRHADARWRQSIDKIAALSILQLELLTSAAKHVKSGGIIVYATCTLHPAENEHVIEQFLEPHSNWMLEKPSMSNVASAYYNQQPWIKLWPHQSQLDGFFIARLRHNPND